MPAGGFVDVYIYTKESSAEGTVRAGRLRLHQNRETISVGCRISSRLAIGLYVRFLYIAARPAGKSRERCAHRASLALVSEIFFPLLLPLETRAEAKSNLARFLYLSSKLRLSRKVRIKITRAYLSSLLRRISQRYTVYTFLYTQYLPRKVSDYFSHIQRQNSSDTLSS